MPLRIANCTAAEPACLNISTAVQEPGAIAKMTTFFTFGQMPLQIAKCTPAQPACRNISTAGPEPGASAKITRAIIFYYHL